MRPRERDFDLRLLLGERDKERDLRPPRFGDLEDLLFVDGGLRRRLGDKDELLRRFGVLDLRGDRNDLLLGVRDREVDHDRRRALLGDLEGGDTAFFLGLGD